VKIDTETGRISYAKNQNEFDEKPAYKIPAEVWGITLTSTERSQLQDGKAVYIADMTGFNGQQFSSWVKMNEKMGKLDYYNENPDRPRQSAGQSESAAAARQDGNRQPDKEAQKQERSQKTGKRPKM
jgi:hypothetical protein